VIAQNRLSSWVHTYDFRIGEGSVGATKMWRAVVSPLLETPCLIHTGFITCSDRILVFECVSIYTINSEQLVDALGIRRT